MPRNACTNCRSSKIKCVVEKPTARGAPQACSRCSSKGITCSYAPDQPSNPLIEVPAGDGSRSSPAFSAAGGASPSVYKLQRDNSFLDIGRGTPRDILREGELTQSLLLLYFSNFSDVHFMFDEELFLRQYTVGEVPKVILYAVMALGIRFSHAPFRDELAPRSHRGEILYEHARQLLQQDFDRPCITSIQAYVLLSTYKVTFGGSMQAYIYLGYATNMLRVLRLLDDDAEVDPLRLECNRRLICTICLMDRLLSFPLRLAPHFSPADPIPVLLRDDEFSALKRRRPVPSNKRAEVDNAGGIDQEIMTLSEILVSTCSIYRSNGSQEALEEQRVRFHRYTDSMTRYRNDDGDLLELHRQNHTLRKFAYMRLLYHHVGMLVHFYTLKDPEEEFISTSGSSSSSSVLECHQHAYAIVEIIEYCWHKAGFDIHNLSIGQILTVATVVHTHALLTTATTGEMASRLQDQVAAMRNCIIRIQEHTRLFNWVLQHLETFWKICCQSTSSMAGIFNHNPHLLGQMLQVGSFYESVDYRTGGRVTHGTENIDPAANLQISVNNDALEETNMDYLGQWPRGMNVDNFDDYAWIFSDSSLLELFSIPAN